MKDWHATFKGWQLFLLVTLLFLASYYVVNQRYDRFYRINDINNDNRAIIEQYLSKKDQEYLVENQISITHLLNYMPYSGFDIHNYKYYEILIADGEYKGSNLVTVGNKLVKKLNDEFNSNQEEIAKYLVSNKLLSAYLEKDIFNYDHRKDYIILKKLYNANGYVDDFESYHSTLASRGFKDAEISQFFQTATKYYSQDSLKILMTRASDQNTVLVDNPSKNTLTLSDNQFIGSYVPSNLVLIEGIQRSHYDMYLKKDAYEALRTMLKDMGKLSDDLVVHKAYVPYKSETNLPGYNEFQLGNTISFTHLDLGFNNFAQSQQAAWLEENAYKYGFVIRYDHDKASITNHTYDAHIYRYVGKDVANKLHENKQSLEEYNIQNEEKK